MRGLFAGLFRLFLSLPGVAVLAALDSSVVFFLPLGIDAGVILVSARQTRLWWLTPVAATAGSLAGAAVTYWLGHKLGERGLQRIIGETRLKRVKRRVTSGMALTVPALALIPPPFPFTPFVLTSGALEVRRSVFFATLAAARLARFGVESVLARRYGRALLAWMESDVFETAVAVFVVIALCGTGISAWRLVRSARRR